MVLYNNYKCTLDSMIILTGWISYKFLNHGLVGHHCATTNQNIFRFLIYSVITPPKTVIILAHTCHLNFSLCTDNFQTIIEAQFRCCHLDTNYINIITE